MEMVSGEGRAGEEVRLGLSRVRSYGTSAVVVERPRHGIVHILVLILALTMAGPAFAQDSTAREAKPVNKPVKMVVLGDSLSAGLGLPASSAFPTRLQKALDDKGIAVEMVNAGVSGDTSSGGRDRLDWSVGEGTEAVIVELGANDALRGVDPAVNPAPLAAILRRLQALGIARLVR